MSNMKSSHNPVQSFDTRGDFLVNIEDYSEVCIAIYV